MKRILFVINTLGGAGAEKALLELLKRFTPDRYEVDLYVLLGQGELISQVPDYVNILNRDYTAESVLSAEGKKELNRKVLRRLFIHRALLKNIPYLIKNSFSMLGRKKIYPDKFLWRIMSDSGMKLNKTMIWQLLIWKVGLHILSMIMLRPGRSSHSCMLIINMQATAEDWTGTVTWTLTGSLQYQGK